MKGTVPTDSEICPRLSPCEKTGRDIARSQPPIAARRSDKMPTDSDTTTGDENTETSKAYQVTLEGKGAYSAPYLDKKEAEDSAEELAENHPKLGEFYVEEWWDYERSVDTGEA